MCVDKQKVGRLWFVIGPSGAGKDSLMLYARERLATGVAAPVFAHRYITRQATAEGENHIALSDVEFCRRERAGCFALVWRRNGLAYGLGVEIDNWLQQGLDVVVNGSRAALPQAQAHYPQLQPLWITASLPVLAKRLAARGRESELEILARLQAAADFSPPAGCRVLLNDGTLAEAGEQLRAWLQPETVT